MGVGLRCDPSKGPIASSQKKLKPEKKKKEKERGAEEYLIGWPALIFGNKTMPKAWRGFHHPSFSLNFRFSFPHPRQIPSFLVPPSYISISWFNFLLLFSFFFFLLLIQESWPADTSHTWLSFLNFYFLCGLPRSFPQCPQWMPLAFYHLVDRFFFYTLGWRICNSCYSI